MRKPPYLLVTFTVLALLGTACRKASSAAGTDPASATRDQAVRFAECVRAKGIAGFPDPDASGRLTIDQVANDASVNTDTAAFKQAIGACRALEPSGFTGGKRSPAQQAAGLQFAQCIREHGVRDFPDPINGEPLVDTNRIPSTDRPGGMAVLNAAMRQCSARGPQ